MNQLPITPSTDDLQQAAQLLTVLGKGRPVFLLSPPTEDPQQLLARLVRGEPMFLPST